MWNSSRQISGLRLAKYRRTSDFPEAGNENKRTVSRIVELMAADFGGV
jgi:hypothetical protein